MVLTFTERKDNQTSNKLNTIAIPLAATPLCMMASTSAYKSGCTTRSLRRCRTFFGMPDPTRCGICSVSLFAPMTRLDVLPFYFKRLRTLRNSPFVFPVNE